MAKDASKSERSDKTEQSKPSKTDEEIVIRDSTTELEDNQDKEMGEEEKDVVKTPEAETGQSVEPEPSDSEGSPTAERPTAQAAKRKKISRKKVALIISGVAVLIIGILFAVPVTRYAIAGLVVKRDVTLTLHDSKTNKPVSQVAVGLDSKIAMTDAKGQATLRSVPVGSKQIKATKKYYKDQSTTVLVPIFGSNPNVEVKFEATGRQVPIRVLNKVSGQPLEGAQVEADGTSSKTDKNGEATLVLPANQTTQSARITLDGYNQSKVTIQITEAQDVQNTFRLVPSGKMYFLSKRTGTINVMKSDLDGENAQTVLAGTGKEEDQGTVLLASRDWKYLALKARRDSDRPKLYLIDTTNGDKLTTMDEGDISFAPVGWYNSYFVFSINRDKLQLWQPKQYALKSFNAKTGSLNVLDETDAAGTNTYQYARETMANSPYVLDNEVVYSKDWDTGQIPMLENKSMTINSVRPDGSGKKVLKSFGEAIGNFINDARLYKPQELYFRVAQNYEPSFWEYEGGNLREKKDLKADDFYKYYPTYLISPSGKSTFWSEPRDGKNTLFVGDAQASNGKEVANLSEFTPYGWFGDEYLLVSKGGSELFILSRTHPSTPLKITDYHKPQASFYGYGYGYGGL